jgi:hypothetical protein
MQLTFDHLVTALVALIGGLAGTSVLWGAMRAQLKQLGEHASTVAHKLDTLIATDAHAAAQLAVHDSRLGASHERVNDLERRVRELEIKAH